MTTKIIDRFIKTDLGIARYNDKRGRYTLVKKGGVQIDLHKQVYRKHYGRNDSDLEIHHKDCDKFNNHYSNLIALPRDEHLWIHEQLGESEYTVRVIENTLADLKNKKRQKLR